jgi:hypothetical protein
MRTYEAKTTGATTKDIVAQQQEMRVKQNNLANSGGGNTVPQFRQSGQTGEDPNALIKSMADKQVQMDENSKYNNCSGSPAGHGTCGGSRKKKVQYQKKNNKKKVTVISRRFYQKKRHYTRNHHNRHYTIKNRHR